MVCWEVIPFLGSSVHECGLAHSSFSSRKMKFSVVSQDTYREGRIVIQDNLVVAWDSYNRSQFYKLTEDTPMSRAVIKGLGARDLPGYYEHDLHLLL